MNNVTDMATFNSKQYSGCDVQYEGIGPWNAVCCDNGG